ncbi:isocitrate lyase/phosphoenolpyruvate mutase family protein [Brevundimonas sp.]|uniref:isocitrate lyase/phosphoenolpyruvate mutase family protein n=1 Tax=Brevundimonas sp. TaxID=1871086 RepID=UPI0025BF800C|nr:isocitrate lyase/phosphoenolpyruvate mutase family protein [Brevundimonas sp.]
MTLLFDIRPIEARYKQCHSALKLSPPFTSLVSPWCYTTSGIRATPGLSRPSGLNLATGSHPVGSASGFGDGQKVPISYVIENARRIIATTDLPLTVTGASDFFILRLTDPGQVERVVREVPLPLNVIAFPVAPPNRDWAAAGVARISHGRFPFRRLMDQLQANAKEAMA